MLVLGRSTCPFQGILLIFEDVNHESRNSGRIGNVYCKTSWSDYLTKFMNIHTQINDRSQPNSQYLSLDVRSPKVPPTTIIMQPPQWNYRILIIRSLTILLSQCFGNHDSPLSFCKELICDRMTTTTTLVPTMPSVPVEIFWTTSKQRNHSLCPKFLLLTIFWGKCLDTGLSRSHSDIFWGCENTSCC